jgi:hypothetical protein
MLSFSVRFVFSVVQKSLLLSAFRRVNVCHSIPTLGENENSTARVLSSLGMFWDGRDESEGSQRRKVNFGGFCDTVLYQYFPCHKDETQTVLDFYPTKFVNIRC